MLSLGRKLRPIPFRVDPERKFFCLLLVLGYSIKQFSRDMLAVRRHGVTDGTRKRVPAECPRQIERQTDDVVVIGGVSKMDSADGEHVEGSTVGGFFFSHHA